MISRFIFFMLMIVSVVWTADHNLTTERTIISVSEVDTLSDWDRLVNAIIYVESRGNDSAIGDNGKAVGCLQIHPIAVREANRILNRDVYSIEDRYSRSKSIEIFNIISEEYECCQEYTFTEYAEIVSRRWNGGPKGDNKKCTEKYWKKVKEKL